jgi:5-methylcytosine-specific restriction endonuclease McrA
VPYKNPERQRRFQNDWMQERRRQWIGQNGPCRQCGSTKYLEVDHINRGDKADHRVWSWGRPRRGRELRECQVLCGDCHIQKTRLEFQGEGGPNAKLTDDEARAVHRLYASGMTQVEVAAVVPVRRSQVGAILRGECWPHIYREFHPERARRSA